MLLVSAADPDATLHCLATLKQKRPDAFQTLASSHSSLKYLIAVTSHSRFLSDEILQNPEWIEQVADLNRVLTAAEYKKRLGKFLKLRPAETPNALSLALFRRQQILRILLRDVLGLGALSETTEELSNLADAILDVSYKRIRAGLRAHMACRGTSAKTANCMSAACRSSRSENWAGAS